MMDGLDKVKRLRNTDTVSRNVLSFEKSALDNKNYKQIALAFMQTLKADKNLNGRVVQK